MLFYNRKAQFLLQIRCRLWLWSSCPASRGGLEWQRTWEPLHIYFNSTFCLELVLVLDMPCRILPFDLRVFCLYKSIFSSHLPFTRRVGPFAIRLTSLQILFHGATGVTLLKFRSSFYGATGVILLRFFSFSAATGVTSLKILFQFFLWSDWGDLASILFQFIWSGWDDFAQFCSSFFFFFFFVIWNNWGELSQVLFQFVDSDWGDLSLSLV